MPVGRLEQLSQHRTWVEVWDSGAGKGENWAGRGRNRVVRLWEGEDLVVMAHR